MKITDYTNEINKIEPSESFISETEALMKKARDEKKTISSYSTGDSMLSFCLTGFSSRGRGILHTAAAAAAVLICAAAIKVYTDGRASSGDIVGETKPAAYEETTAEAPSETSVSEEQTEIYDDDAPIEEDEEENIEFNLTTDDGAPETTAPMRTEDDLSAVPAQTSASVNVYTESIPAVTSAPVSPAENTSSAVSHRKRTENITSVTSADDVPGNVSGYRVSETALPEETKGIPETDITVDVSADDEEPDVDPGVYGYYDDDDYEAMEEYAAEEEYEESSEGEHPTGYGGAEYVSAQASENPSGGNGLTEEAAPVFTSGFDEEYSFDEEDDEEGGHYSQTLYGSVSALYRYSSDLDVISAADEVYVPDNINMLEEGTFYAEIITGYDVYDESTGSISGGELKTIPESRTDDLSAVISCISDICYKNNAVYSARKTDMVNFRNKITVCSAVDGERGAVMFEIIYDEQTLIINRYDNGTESSEIYMISEEYADELDEALNSVL